MILAQLSSGLAGLDMLKLKIKDYNDGLIESIDDNDIRRNVCLLHMFRKKTDKEFTTFFSEEAVIAIEKYLELECIDINDDEALFASYKAGGKHMGTTALQMAYRYLNKYSGGEQEEKGRFRKATSHMMRKTFNTLLINAGMLKEIRGHFMGHGYNDKVRDTYFLADPQELLKVYLKYMDYVTIEKREVSSEELINDQGLNNAKISELELMLEEMKKKLDKVSVEA
ncbi:tyrosine-type recombinase/integrase [Methanobacterium sp. ACI-7]|uniref:tyrosine-type recombinase/integrase n=1 Tax=unclassified Methanobacterium TaxID=2627676 RepID=UPI0039C352BC